MSNKIKYNLKNVYAAVMTRSGSTYTYATPVAIPGAVSMSLDAEGEASPFYADGIVYFRSAANNGYSGDLEIALIPEWFREQVLLETKDSNNVFIETKEASIEPGTETLSLTADPREDGLVKARTGDDTTTAVYNAWYQSVYTPAVSSGGSGSGSSSNT